jgi:hypothetical protein
MVSHPFREAVKDGTPGFLLNFSVETALRNPGSEGAALPPDPLRVLVIHPGTCADLDLQEILGDGGPSGHILATSAGVIWSRPDFLPRETGRRRVCGFR